MKLVTPREPFLQRLQFAASVCPTRSPRPILSDVLVRVDGDTVHLTASDGDAVSVRLSYTAEGVEGDGSAALPATTLLSAVRSMTADTIKIEPKDQAHELTGGNAQFTLNGDDPELYPSFPEVEVEVVEVPLGAFAGLCARTMFAAAREMGRYAFNGVLLELDPQEITLVATDGRRLSMARLDHATGISERRSVVVPLKALNQLQRSGANPDVVLRIGVRDTLVTLDLPDVQVVAQVVQGEFPDFRAVLPNEADIPEVVTLDREEFASAIQRASIMAGDEGPSVELSFRPGSLEILSRQEGLGEARSEVDIEYAGDEQAIRFNPAFLGEYLKSFPDPQVAFRFKDRASAGMFKTSDDAIYVVMPITS
jgi:DNA polymerase-3 subunit beta